MINIVRNYLYMIAIISTITKTRTYNMLYHTSREICDYRHE